MKRSVYLFSLATPMGQMFSLSESEIEDKINEGWTDSPAKLELPESTETNISKEDAKNANPQDLCELVRSYGFFVLTQEQLQAEAVKMASVAFNAENLTDEAIIAEAVRRGLKDADPVIEEGEIIEAKEDNNEISEESTIQGLQDIFDEEPEALNIDELVRLGNEKYTLGLRSNMKEATLIGKIIAAM